MEELKKLSDAELERAIVEKYGEDWKPEQLDENDKLVKEWLERLTTGYFSPQGGSQ